MPAHRAASVEALGETRPGTDVSVTGRVIHSAEGELCVADLTGRVVVHGAGPGPAQPGSWVVCRGRWDGQELQQATWTVETAPSSPYPVSGGDTRWLGDDGGRRARLLAGRARVLRAVRAFFEAEGFLEVETPLMVPSPGLDLHLDAFEVAGTGQYLITSPEYQMKRLLVAGLPRIVQVCRCFRRAEAGPLHQPEFSMVEWYRAFAGADEVMEDTERLVAHVATEVTGSTVIHLPGTGRTVDLSPPWERLTVAEAFRRHAGVATEEILPDEERFFRVLVAEVEPRLAAGPPVFLTRWPASMASLARLCPDDPAVADRFEAYVGGVELCNGFGELTDPAEQRARLIRDQEARRAQDRPVYPVDERFVGALMEGMPPAGGNALGLDRLVMLVLGQSRIDDVLAIPASRL